MRHVLLLPLFLLSCAPHASECRREHGTIRMEQYLEERGLSSCPGVPEARCRGRFYSFDAAACILFAKNLDDYDEYRSEPLGGGLAFDFYEEISLTGLTYLPGLSRGEFVWQLEVESSSGGTGPHFVSAETGAVLDYVPELLDATPPF